MRIMTKNQAIDYLKEHAEPAGGKWHSNFYRVTKELKVFKKAYSGHNSVIVNLIIPVGAIVHFPEIIYDNHDIDNRKMRASKAIVHSMATKFKKKELTVANSDWDCNFEYKVGKTVKPFDEKFSSTPRECEAGIHFFMQVEDALKY